MKATIVKGNGTTFTIEGTEQEVWKIIAQIQQYNIKLDHSIGIAEIDLVERAKRIMHNSDIDIQLEMDRIIYGTSFHTEENGYKYRIDPRTVRMVQSDKNKKEVTTLLHWEAFSNVLNKEFASRCLADYKVTMDLIKEGNTMTEEEYYKKLGTNSLNAPVKAVWMMLQQLGYKIIKDK